MCAIVDANVGHEVFSPTSRSPAGEYFRDWLARPTGGTLVAGGAVLRELGRIGDFQQFFEDRLLAGRARRVEDRDVDTETDSLRSQGVCRSNDEHVIALARLSGARLLFTNDNALQDDFRDRRIVAGTRGRIYTTGRYDHVTVAQQRLLRRRDLCDG